jgi:hypothetical protein
MVTAIIGNREFEMSVSSVSSAPPVAAVKPVDVPPPAVKADDKKPNSNTSDYDDQSSRTAPPPPPAPLPPGQGTRIDQFA